MRTRVIEQRFSDYVNGIIRDNETERVNYDLKVEHTNRVRDNMILIGKLKELRQEDVDVGEVIGLLHDIGRFKQYSEYKSFSDAITGSHADISVDLIEEYDLLREFNIADQLIIKDSIKYHNYFQLPRINDARLLMFSKMIRDADKLDAFWGEVGSDMDSRRYDLEALSSEKEFSEEVLNDILNNRQVDFKNLKYKLDRRLGILGLLFDINFAESFEIVKKHEYIESLLAPLKNDQERQMIIETCKKYIENK